MLLQVYNCIRHLVSAFRYVPVDLGDFLDNDLAVDRKRRETGGKPSQPYPKIIYRESCGMNMESICQYVLGAKNVRLS